MPNHVTNILTIEGDPERVKACMDAIRGEEGARIDFEKIIPCPFSDPGNVPSNVEGAAERALWHVEDNSSLSQLKVSLWLTGPSPLKFSDENWDLFIEYLQRYRKFGAMNWYQWNIKHWGTKWNAYDTPTPRDTEDTIWFDTAWSTPEPVFAALAAQWPDLTFRVKFADEDMGHNTGILTLTGETLVFEDMSCTQGGKTRKEARSFAFSVLNPGGDPADWDLDENFEYVEQEAGREEDESTTIKLIALEGTDGGDNSGTPEESN